MLRARRRFSTQISRQLSGSVFSVVKEVVELQRIPVNQFSILYRWKKIYERLGDKRNDAAIEDALFLASSLMQLLRMLRILLDPIFLLLRGILLDPMCLTGEKKFKII